MEIFFQAEKKCLLPSYCVKCWGNLAYDLHACEHATLEMLLLIYYLVFIESGVVFECGLLALSK